MRLPQRRGDVDTVRQSISGKRLLTTIAFSDSQSVEWQIQLLQRHVADAVHLVADNSPDDAQAAAIEKTVKACGSHYIRLPANPWQEPSRSHGIALNWVWHNVILPGQPDAFGFLDDDLYPTQPDDPFRALSTQDCYGVVRDAGERWFLWAGFCFFRFSSVQSLSLDFGQDWFNGLDSGGGNWRVLYRNLDRLQMQEQQSAFVPFKPGIAMEDAPYQWCGTWLHEVGLMGKEELREEKREATAHLIHELLSHRTSAD
jgi:hypothetical protein